MGKRMLRTKKGARSRNSAREVTLGKRENLWLIMNEMSSNLNKLVITCKKWRK